VEPKRGVDSGSSRPTEALIGHPLSQGRGKGREGETSDMCKARMMMMMRRRRRRRRDGFVSTV